MNKELVLVRLDDKYCDYLRNYDNKVPYNFGNKKLRPYVGVLFKVNKYMYFAPLSSPKAKHLKLKTKLDFIKLDRGRLGAINFNNMLPVTKRNIKVLDLNRKCRSSEERQYNKLLKEQIYWLNRNKVMLYNRSKNLYHKYLDGTLDKNIKLRCCNFKLLEEKCIEYNKDLRVKV